MKVRILVLCSAFLFIAGLTCANATTINTYGSLATWAAATGPYLVEDFNDNILNTGLSQVGGQVNGLNAPGKFWDQATTTTGATFTFATPITALGGIWDLANPGGPGIGLEIELTDGTITPVISNQLSNDFWGFTSSLAFTTAYIYGDSLASGIETYTLDDMVYSPVPEPATMLLLGTGLVGVAGAARRKKKNQA